MRQGALEDGRSVGQADGMTWLLVKLAIRFVVFAGVFFLATWKNPKLKVEPKWALPVVGLVFALLNAGIYWAAKPVLNLVTLGMGWFLVPLVVNAGLFWLTYKVVTRMRVKMHMEGMMPAVKLVLLLTAAHGALWLAMDVIAK
jgi:hypothetical protein